MILDLFLNLRGMKYSLDLMDLNKFHKRDGMLRKDRWKYSNKIHPYKYKLYQKLFCINLIHM